MASSDSAAANRPAPAPVNGASLPPLTGGALVLGSIALSLATFMNVLDLSIANVSIPAISGDLGVSPNQGTWVITSFGVANAISLPLTGWLTRRYGQVRLFLAAVVLFVIASFLCALAPSIELLILWVGALQITLDKGKDLDWFESSRIVLLVVVAVVAFVIFLVWELTEKHPIVDLTLFKRRNFWTSTLSMALAYGAFFGNVVL